MQVNIFKNHLPKQKSKQNRLTTKLDKKAIKSFKQNIKWNRGRKSIPDCHQGQVHTNLRKIND